MIKEKQKKKLYEIVLKFRLMKSRHVSNTSKKTTLDVTFKEIEAIYLHCQMRLVTAAKIQK